MPKKLIIQISDDSWFHILEGWRSCHDLRDKTDQEIEELIAEEIRDELSFRYEIDPNASSESLLRFL